MTDRPSNRPQRRSPRKAGFDYTTPGAYFVTICSHNRRHIFGHIASNQMVLSSVGQIAQDRWAALPDHHPQVKLDQFVIMPNHVHGIIWLHIEPDTNLSIRTAPVQSVATVSTEKAEVAPGSLGAVVRSYKASVTRIVNQQESGERTKIWQGRYHDSIIRTERALHAIRRYIVENPCRWMLDRHNPNRVGPEPYAREIWKILEEDESVL